VRVIALFIALIVQSVLAQTFNEYQIKAIFLFNFAQFVDWSQPAKADAPFVIGVLGEDPFRDSLEDTVRGERLDARPFLVRHYRTVHDIADCQILFVSGSEARQLSALLEALRGRRILTVSDVEDFALRGGMVQFVTESKRIKLKINVDAARAANLTLSSKLLRPATIVSLEKD